MIAGRATSNSEFAFVTIALRVLWIAAKLALDNFACVATNAWPMPANCLILSNSMLLKCDARSSTGTQVEIGSWTPNFC